MLAALPYAEARTLTACRTTDKRMGMLSGERAGCRWWMTTIGSALTITHSERLRTDARTARTSRKFPRVQKAKDGSILVGAAGGRGFECRSLFTAPGDWLLVGADMAGLELRCLAHCLAPFDVGAYTAIVCATGDPHSATEAATGLASRETAKRL